VGEREGRLGLGAVMTHGRHVPTKVATVEQAAAIAELLHDAGWDAWHEGGLQVCVGLHEWLDPMEARLLVLTAANRVDKAGEVRC